MKRIYLPIGYDDFEQLRNENLYYVDKTNLIKELIQQNALVTIITRPRRFGKSLNMSMLREFFEIGGDPKIFEGLSILEDHDVCDEYFHKYPVIHLSLKDLMGDDFESAKNKFELILHRECERLIQQYGLEEDILEQLRNVELSDSISFLMHFLKKITAQKVIVLIDEYDVPLEKAYYAGYYTQMVSLIRAMFSLALKGNTDLAFAVLTGCMRISKESIFTGFNNFKVQSITDERFDEWFGFTDCEVKEMLQYYGIEQYYKITKQWYDGYRFGDQNVYCPWDVINWVTDIINSKNPLPALYWANTSGNAIVQQLAKQSTLMEKDKIERLIAGESIREQVHAEMTYGDLENHNEYVWTILFLTGYLTFEKKYENDFYDLRIPNQEVKEIFKRQIMEYFKRQVNQNIGSIQEFCSFVEEGKPEEMQRYLNRFLNQVISIRDTQNKSKTENFYQGMIATMCATRSDSWMVKTQRESGLGYPDVLVYDPLNLFGVVFEIKYADSRNDLENAARDALRQIEDKNYGEIFRDQGIENVKKYGISFYQKSSYVIMDMK